VNAAFMRGRVVEREPQMRAITQEFMDAFFAAGRRRHSATHRPHQYVDDL
jgi:hypothetical protein